MTATEERLNGAWWLLRVGLGLGAFLAGLDKFFDILTTWSMYLAPLAERLLPISSDAFFRVIGVVEMIVGLAILTRWTRLGAYAMAAWLVGIAVNLALAAHFWDLVVRDLEVAISAFALARLTEWRAAAIAGVAPARGPEQLQHQEART
jgi:DoxX